MRYRVHGAGRSSTTVALASPVGAEPLAGLSPQPEPDISVAWYGMSYLHLDLLQVWTYSKS